jgi:hypothetical protein
MSDVYVYDKAKYHNESIFEHGLAEEHAANHAVPILRWFIENDLMCEKFISSSLNEIAEFKAGKMTIHELYFRLGNCLTSTMFSKRGNDFAMYYFDFQRGNYIKDYRVTLQGSLPTELHISYSDDNYKRLKPLIDSAFSRWSSAKSWWKIWK